MSPWTPERHAEYKKTIEQIRRSAIHQSSGWPMHDLRRCPCLWCNCYRVTIDALAKRAVMFLMEELNPRFLWYERYRLIRLLRRRTNMLNQAAVREVLNQLVADPDRRSVKERIDWGVDWGVDWGETK